MCLLRPYAQVKPGQKRHEYGILLHDIEESSHTGTSLMTDGRLVTLPLDKLHLAFKRVRDDDYLMSVASCKQCYALYKAASSDEPALELRIANSVAEYYKAIADASAARSAKQAERAKTLAKQTANPKVTMSHICLGTSVSMFFTWKELGCEPQQPSKCEAKNSGYDKSGMWRTGSITKITKNKFRKYVYESVFDISDGYTGSFTSVEIKEARKNFLKIQALHAAALSSSDDGFSSMDGDDDMLTAQRKTSSLQADTHKPVTQKRRPGLVIKGTQDDTGGEIVARAVLDETALQKGTSNGASETNIENEDTCERTATDSKAVGKGVADTSTTNAETTVPDLCAALNESAVGLPATTPPPSTTGFVAITKEAEDTTPGVAAPSIQPDEGAAAFEQDEEAAARLADTGGEGQETLGENDTVGIDIDAEAKPPTIGGEGAPSATTRGRNAENTTPDVAASSIQLDLGAAAVVLDEEETASIAEPCGVGQKILGDNDTQGNEFFAGANGGTTVGVGHPSLTTNGSDNVSKSARACATNVEEISAEDIIQLGSEGEKTKWKNDLRLRKLPSISPPAALYGREDKALRRRIFPCPSCSKDADGSHQCGVCFAHVHVPCGTPYNDSPEGFGQVLLCTQCSSVDNRGVGPEDAAFDEADDDDDMDTATQQRLTLGKELCAAMGGDKPKKCHKSPLVTTKMHPRKTKRMLRLLQKKIAIAKAQNKLDVAKQLRKAAVKLLQHGHRHSVCTTVGGINEIDTPAVTTPVQQPNEAGAHTQKLRKRGSDDAGGTGKTTHKRAKRITLTKQTSTPDATIGEVTQSQACDVKPHNRNEETPTVTEEEGGVLNDDEWYWDQKYMTWVFTGSKRARKRDLTNKAERNWVLGMRRNANTEKQAKLVEKITITREHLSSVRTLSFILSTLDRVY